MTNPAVIAAWKIGIPGHSANLRTDGHTLWAFRIILGWTEDRVKKVYLFRASREVTKTLTHYVEQARKVAAVEVIPTKAQWLKVMTSLKSTSPSSCE